VKSDGTFSFRNLQPGVYSLTVNSVGHLYHSIAKVSVSLTASDVTLLLGRDGSVEVAGSEAGKTTDTDQLTNKGSERNSAQ